MHDPVQLQNFLTIGGLLFVLGLVGFITRRNVIVMFLCAEMMLQGISLSLISFGRFHNDWGGQMLVIFIITVAACEAAIALALIVTIFQRSGKLDIAFWQEMREDSQPAYKDRHIPEEPVSDRAWPHLTPAGVRPAVDDESQMHRTRV